MDEQALKLQFLQEFVKRVTEDTKGLISISLVSTTDNSVILHKAVNPFVDNSKSAIYQLNIVKSLTRGMDYFPSVTNHDIRALTISYEGQKHLVFFTPNRSIIAHIIVEETENLKLLQFVVNKHITDLITELAQKAGAGILGSKIDLRL